MSYILKVADGYLMADGNVSMDQRDAMRVPDGTRLVHLKRSRDARPYDRRWSDIDTSPAPMSPDGRYDDTDF